MNKNLTIPTTFIKFRLNLFDFFLYNDIKTDAST